MNSKKYDATSMSLLQRATSNDNDAWKQIVHLYGPLVSIWCKRSGLQDNDVADVFQETFRSVAGGLASYKPSRSVGSFRAWLRAIVRSKVADHFRRLQRHPPGKGGSDAQMMLGTVADPLSDDDEEDAAEENAIVVQRAMELIKSEFTPRNWAAFQQVAFEGLSAVEVAEKLNLNPQTVRQANYRIRRRLRLVLQDLVDDL